MRDMSDRRRGGGEGKGSVVIAGSYLSQNGIVMCFVVSIVMGRIIAV
jgi:hypothetical protein